MNAPHPVSPRLPQTPETLVRDGNQYLAQHQFTEALRCYEQVLAAAPDSADDPNTMVAILNSGNAWFALQQPDKALPFYERAYQQTPDHVVVLYSMGNCLLSMGRWDEAADYLVRAVERQPDLATAHSTLGIVRQHQDRLEEAVTCYETAIRLSPGQNAEAYNNLGALYLERKDYERALALFERSLQINPKNVQAHNNKGTLHLEKHQLALAASCFQRSIQLNPKLVESYRNLARVRMDQGQPMAAIDVYGDALKVHPDHDALRICRAKVLPPIYTSKADLAFWRRRYETELETLVQTGARVSDPAREIASANFYLAYQGLDNRKLQEQYASLFDHVPKYRTKQPSRHHAKPRVGFISSLLYPEHTIGKHFLGLAEHLSRDRFEVVLITLGTPRKTLLENPHTHVHLQGESFAHIRDLLHAQDLDALIYTDIGMEPLTYFLAFERLAPIQCTLWGHPDTTGIPAMDYFLSNETFETPESRHSYSETLKIFDRMITYFPRLTFPDKPYDRAYFGLPADRNLYYCPQSLFKIHPDFDELLGNILRRDPKGMVVFIRGNRPQWSDLLMQRFQTTIGDVAHRIHFIERLSRQDFLASLQVADVLIDSMHFSAGSTAFEILAAGQPLVTYPQSFLRSRIPHACYAQIGVSACTAHKAEDYVERAVALATDPVHREAVCAQIRDSRHALFEDITAVRLLEDFLTEAYEALA